MVTGAGSGIGREIARTFAAQGSKVEILDLDLGAARKAAAEINASLGQTMVRAHSCDVTQMESVEAVFTAITTGPDGGRVDILVNNAGIGHVGTVETTDAEAMDRMYAVNVKGVYHCLQAAVSRMMTDGKGGAILNLASIASLIGLNDRFAYSMSKGAVLTMTLSVATDYVKKGIRCNCICPARIHTPFVDAFLAKSYPGQESSMFKQLSEYQPIGRMGTPKEVAAVALFLCSDEAAFITGAA